MSTSTVGATTLDVQSIVGAMTKSQNLRISKIQSTQQSYTVKISELGKVKAQATALQDDIGKVNSATSTTTTASLKATLKDLASNYNSLKSQTQIRNLNYDVRAHTDSTATKELGLSIDKNGIMSFDETKFDAAASADFSKVIANANTAFAGVVARPQIFQKALDPVYGSLNTQANTLQKRIDSLQKQNDVITRQTETLTQSYTAQMNNLQNYINNMNVNQNSISQLIGKA